MAIKTVLVPSIGLPFTAPAEEAYTLAGAQLKRHGARPQNAEYRIYRQIFCEPS